MELEKFLAPQVEDLIFIAHPLFPGGGRSYYRIHRNGDLVETREEEPPAGPGPARYLRELRRTWWHARSLAPIDLYVGGDSLLALPGIWLRRRGKAHAVVLYSMDFVPHRFANPALNALYHRIDRFAAEFADVAWNVSHQIDAARRERDRGHELAPTVLVPIGVHTERIARKPLAEASAKELAFVSHLIPKQGLQLVIQAMPAIRAAVPEATVVVIGDGPYANELKRLAQVHRVADAIHFLGQENDHEKLEQRITRSALALAPYVPDPANFTRFADPSKIKLYLACGLPIIMTDEFWNARDIERSGAGVIIPYDTSALASAVIAYLSNPQALEVARNAAGKLAADFAWDRVFTSALTATGDLLVSNMAT